MDRPVLRCTSGGLAGRSIELESELMIGRAFPDPGPLNGDPRLSRRHARVHRDDAGRWVLEDIGSANGTWLNGQRISSPQALKPGDVVTLGETVFEVATSRPEAAAPADTGRDEPGAAPADDQPAPAAVGEQPQQAPREDADGPQLTVTNGSLSGRVIGIGDEFLIGRSYRGDGSLGDNPKLSRRHARIAAAADGSIFIDDTGSTNGTFVNGQRLRGPRALRNGDEVRAGDVTMRVSHIPAEQTSREPLSAASHGFAPRGAAGARRRTRTIVVAFATVLAAVVGVSIAVVAVLAPSGPKTCALDRPCQPPPTSPPLATLVTYRGSLGYTAEYNADKWTVAKQDGSNLELSASTNAGDISLWIQGVPGTGTQEAAQSRLNALSGSVIGMAGDPAIEHRLFLPTVGFRSGVGGSFAGTVNSPQGADAPVTIAVMASSDGKATVVVSAQIPAAGAEFHNAAAGLVDQVIKTIRFPSDGGV